MKKININRNWLIQNGVPSTIPGMPQQTREVNLPHDFMIEGDVRQDSKNGALGGYYCGGTYSYTKKLTIPQEWEGQRILLNFEGVYGLAKVSVNGRPVGIHHYGYTPFQVDITGDVYYGAENRICVSVSTDNEPNSRWYSGGGIYRDVDLLLANPVHIAPDGLYLHTDHITNGDAFVTAEAVVENHTAQDRCAWVEFTVGEASGKIKFWLPAGKSGTARTQICVPEAKLWDLDAPNLYAVHAVLLDEEGVLDEADTRFGIRTVSVDAKNGFCLNGRSLKLKGGCVHHDNGILGAVALPDSEYRKVKLHKDAGYNALRTAHNPPSPAFLDACDELGILVLAEAFDTWRMAKNYHDFSQHFDTEWERELTAFITRDRNHPSIFMWSVGNELPEQGGLAGGYEISAKLTDAVRKLDGTRPVGGSLCSFFSGLDDRDNGKFWQSIMQEAMASGGTLNNLDGPYGKQIWNGRTEAFCAPWDVVGYNYLDYHYEEAGELFPNRVVCSTESKPNQTEKYWHDVLKYPYLIGDFIWTSMDYLGEAGIGKVLHATPDQAAQMAQRLHYAEYPWRAAGCGDFDLCGFETPQGCYRRILWGSGETVIVSQNPALHDLVEICGRYGWPDVQRSWTWPATAGAPVKVEVYSAAPEVELILNGESQGRKATEHLKAAFELTYQPGTLEAIGYDGDREVSRDTLHTAREIAGIRITPERCGLKADGKSLCYATVEFVDKDGNAVPYAEMEAAAQITGYAVLQGFGSARPKTEENYTAGKATSYKGKLLAVVRAGTEAGKAVLTVKAAGLPEAVLEIEIGE